MTRRIRRRETDPKRDGAMGSSFRTAVLCTTCLVVGSVVSDFFSVSIQSPAVTSVRRALSSITQSSTPVYHASDVEDFVVSNSERLGYTGMSPRACALWDSDGVGDMDNPYKLSLSAYRKEQAEYNQELDKMVEAFGRTNIKDLRLHLESGVCDYLEMNLPDIFRTDHLSQSEALGYMEPLLPPLRDSSFCFNSGALLSLDYLIHDFGAMCRQLKRTSRTVFIDMGASLEFHGGGKSPAIYITELYQQLGFRFDHVYAYEVTPQEPDHVFDRVPSDLMSAYHWINVGVSSEVGGKMNPLTMLAENFNEDDFVVVKLDIDTPSIEIPLAHQILQDDRISKLVDVFYFEHHVHMAELAGSWQDTMEGTMADSLKLFQGMREKGIAAHSWV